MNVLEVLLHELFTFSYQLMFFLLLFCRDARVRRLGYLRYAALVLVLCFPGTVYYLSTGSTIYQLDIFTFGGWYSYFYLAFSLLAALALPLCFDMRLKEAAFFTIGAYITQHLTNNCIQLLAAFFEVKGRNTAFQLLCLCLLAVIVVVFQRGIRPNIRRDICEINIESPTMLFFLLFAMLFINVLTSWIYQQEGGNISRHLGYYYYGALSSVLLLVLQFGMLDLTEAIREKKAMDDILEKAEKQYIQSKENIETLNEKYHDFKYRLLELSSSGAEGDGRAYLSETLRLIDNYEDSFQTGNEALDILLTEKSALCKKEDILLTCFADGEAISFMKPADIYLLFGNALDNAIEALTGSEANTARAIDVSITRKNSFAVICIENDCPREVVFDKGRPLTSKEDKAFHGFGTKSIQYIVDKYSGNLVFSCEDHIFSVRCLIPCQLQKMKG